MNKIQAVAKEHFFKHIDGFMDYRKIIYETSDQTIKSNHIDIELFRDFLDMKQYHYIDGKAVMDFQYYLKQQRRIHESKTVYPQKLCQISKTGKYSLCKHAAVL